MSTKSDDDLQPSKSQRKRDMDALQKIGETLVRLPAAQLAKIPLPGVLADAVKTARELKSHEAIRRQLQYIGKIMRFVEAAPIQEAINAIEQKSKQGKAQFHQIERWRDKLIAEDDEALQDFLDKFPHTGRQHLRQLVRNAKKRENADTELFRYLREMIEGKK